MFPPFKKKFQNIDPEMKKYKPLAFRIVKS